MPIMSILVVTTTFASTFRFVLKEKVKLPAAASLATFFAASSVLVPRLVTTRESASSGVAADRGGSVAVSVAVSVVVSVAVSVAVSFSSESQPISAVSDRLSSISAASASERKRSTVCFFMVISFLSYYSVFSIGMLFARCSAQYGQSGRQPERFPFLGDTL